MPKITLTPDDMKKGALLPNGWHKAEVVDAIAKPSKAGDSINYTATFRLVDYDDGNHKIDRLFNSKGIGYIKPFLAALEGVTMADFLVKHKDGIEFEFEATKGGKCQIYLSDKRREDNGELKTEVKDFAPFDFKAPF